MVALLMLLPSTAVMFNGAAPDAPKGLAAASSDPQPEGGQKAPSGGGQGNSETPTIDPVLVPYTSGSQDAAGLLRVTLLLPEPQGGSSSTNRATAATERANRVHDAQSGLVAFLGREQAAGHATGIEPVTGVNAITVSVDQDLLQRLSHRHDITSIYAVEKGRSSPATADPFHDAILKHKALPGRKTSMSPQNVTKLEAPTDLHRVAPPPISTVQPDWAQKWTDASALWNTSINGSGQTVALLDTGIWAGNPELQGTVTDWLDLTRISSDRANGSWAWHAGVHGDDASLVRSVNLSGKTTAALSFRQFRDFRNCYYDPTDPSQQSDVDNYCNSGRVEVVNASGTTVLGRWIDQSDGSEVTTLDLSQFHGQNVTLRFYMRSYYSGYADGWFLDDIKVVADGAQVFKDDVETLDSNWTVSNFARWNTAIYDAPMLASGNAAGPLVTVSPSFNLTGDVTPTFTMNYFSDLPDCGGCWDAKVWFSVNHSAWWPAGSPGYTYSAEGLRAFTFAAEANNLSNVPDLRIAIGMYKAYTSGHPLNEGTPGAYYDELSAFRGFALHDLSFTSANHAGVTRFLNDSSYTGWSTDQGFSVRAISTIPYDDEGHGTETGGIIVGSGTHGWHRGIAPAAKIAAVKVFDRYGSTGEARLLRALDWVSAQGAVQVLSYSGGGFDFSETSTDDTWPTIPNGTVASYAFNVTSSPSTPGTWALGYVQNDGPDGEADPWSFGDPEPLATSFVDPAGHTYNGHEVDWVLSPGNGQFSDNDNRAWYHKLNPGAALADGTWHLNASYDAATHPVAHSGSRSMWSGQGNAPDVSPGSQRSALTREFDFSGLKAANLSFWSRWNTERYNDCGHVIVDDGNGTHWDSAGDTSLCYSNIDNDFSNDGMPHAWKWGWFDGWNGNAFENLTFNLSQFAGHRFVNITFESVYDTSVEGEGWYVDDVSIPELGYSEGFEGDATGWHADAGRAQTWHNVSSLEAAVGLFAVAGVGYPDDGTSPVSLAVDHVASTGILPVIAAGNDGGFKDCWPSGCGPTGARTMDSPGAARGAYAVGATAVEQDLVTSFSSRGPVGFGSHAYAKP
ncbi:MAG: S8 family serine peptidase, partial [Thermoplasmatota archaeon]